MTDVEIISILNSIVLRLNQILPAILLIAGTFGHMSNIIIFSKRSQRTNPVSIYFLSSTIANIFVLYGGVLMRYLVDTQQIDPVNNNTIVCKIRSFVLYLSLSLSNWYILLATIDRYLISSKEHLRRQLSTLKNAYRIIIGLTIVFVLSYSHILILYTIQSSVNTSNRTQNYCYPQRGPYRMFSDIQLLVQFSLLPLLLMSVFIVLIIRNIRYSRARMATTVAVRQQARLRKRDLQLSKMLLLQVIITIVCSLPLAISQLITTLTLTWTKTMLRLAVESFLSQIGRHLAFTNCSISFYLYTLAGSQFRREIQGTLNRVAMCICPRRLLRKPRVDVDGELRPGNGREPSPPSHETLERTPQTVNHKAERI